MEVASDAIVPKRFGTTPGLMKKKTRKKKQTGLLPVAGVPKPEDLGGGYLM
jgi:hypothetical protein